jgi:hypothetical protein
MGTDGLEVGDGGEPLAKGGLVGGIDETEKVGGAVTEAVGPRHVSPVACGQNGSCGGRLVGFRTLKLASTPVAVPKEKQPQEQQDHGERDDACEDQARRTRL